MNRKFVEPLEQRQFLTAATADLIETAFRAPRSAAETHEFIQDPAAKTNLTAAEVETILGRAASQARPGQVIVVMDDEGITLGVVATTGASDNIDPSGQPYPTGLDEQTFLIATAAARARTGAFFQSNENAFTTRTARFIIQDHFPHPIRNTPGGPLYGVQYSSYRGTDVLRDEQSGFPALSGDPGGIPIYKDGIKCGGIGVAGDGRDIAARPELVPFGVPGSNPRGRAWQGREESDFDEAVALAGVRTDFATPTRIRATNIFVDGLRFPFTRNRPAKSQPVRTLSQITAAGQAQLVAAPLLLKPDAAIRASTPPPFARATFGGVEGYLKRQFEVDAAGNKTPVPNTLEAQIVASNDTSTSGVLLPEAQRLTEPTSTRSSTRPPAPASTSARSSASPTASAPACTSPSSTATATCSPPSAWTTAPTSASTSPSKRPAPPPFSPTTTTRSPPARWGSCRRSSSPSASRKTARSPGRSSKCRTASPSPGS